MLQITFFFLLPIKIELATFFFPTLKMVQNTLILMINKKKVHQIFSFTSSLELAHTIIKNYLNSINTSDFLKLSGTTEKLHKCRKPLTTVKNLLYFLGNHKKS